MTKEEFLTKWSHQEFNWNDMEVDLNEVIIYELWNVTPEEEI